MFVFTVVPPLVLEFFLENDQLDSDFGNAVSSAGDVNGDGYSDVLVSAYMYSNGEDSEGRVFLYLGSPTGLGTTAVWTAESDQVSALFGSGLSSAGDVNGDGFDDVIVGAFGYDEPDLNEGKAFVYLGSTLGLEAAPAWTTQSDQVQASLGSSVSSAGDVNGDGYDDVVVGAYQYDGAVVDGGLAEVFLGSPTGLELTPSWTTESALSDTFYGWAVSSAGDVNADGYDDVVVGARNYDHGEDLEGMAFLYLGSAAGLDTIPAWAVQSNVEGAFFGSDVAAAGDVDGDGYDDVAVVSDLNANGRLVFRGSPTGLEPTAAWRLGPPKHEQGWDSTVIGTSVSSAGDVNGDGFADIILGVPNTGDAFLYLGSPSGPASQSDFKATELGGVDADAAFGGFDVAGAGDIDGDGFDDVLITVADDGVLALGAVAVFMSRCSEDTDDTDADGVVDACDTCAGGDDLVDGDADTVPDACDVCPTQQNPDQVDADGNGIGDVCEEVIVQGATPGIAGQNNTWTLSGAPAGADVKWLWGTSLGVTPTTNGCADVALDLDTPKILGLSVTDAEGRAELVVSLPTKARGNTMHVQAFVPFSCATSNVATTTFP